MVFFPVQALFHLLARLAYVVASILAVLSVLALTVGLLPQVHEVVAAMKEFEFPRDELLFGAILLVDLVFVAYLVDKCKGRMRASLAQLRHHFRQALGRSWVPPIRVKEGLVLTWQEVRSLPNAVVDGFRPSSVIFLSAIVLFLAALFAQVALGVPDTGHEHEDTDRKLKSLMDTVAEGGKERGRLSGEVKGIKKDLRELAGGVKSLDSLIKGHTHNGVDGASAFYLMFDDPNLDDGTGICLDGANQRWVLGLRQAIRGACDGELEDMAVEVTGFSSIAPVFVSGSDEMSDVLNCEIANLRAAAVVEMFRQENEERASMSCRNAVAASFKGKPELCDGKGGTTTEGSTGDGLNVVYRPWSDWGVSKDQRPVYDGTATSRIRGAEAMNRVVKVVVRGGGCLLGHRSPP